MKMSFAGQCFLLCSSMKKKFSHYTIVIIICVTRHHAAGICESLLRKRNDDGRQHSALALSKY